MVNSISRAELAKAITAGQVTVVDALPAVPYANRHLPGAVNLTIEDIDSASERLPDQAAAIVTYSTDSTCHRGPDLAEALTVAGYTRVRNYTDGIADWAAAELPLETGIPATDPGSSPRGSD